MKRGVFLLSLFLFSIVFSSISLAQLCDYSPKCEPVTRQCGCGGTQTRYTLCDGGCSDWYACSVLDIEQSCSDGTDDDCDGLADCRDSDCSPNDNCVDEDNDGYPRSRDCNDFSAKVNPAMQETCNMIDDDCDYSIDEDISRECGTSNLGICRMGTETCSIGVWSGCNAITPKTESCNGLDDNCDGVVDEGCACRSGEEQDCGTDVGACSLGKQSCINGAWSSCSGALVPKDEICNNDLDDDCDSEVDEGCVSFSVAEQQEAVAEQQEQEEKPAAEFKVVSCKDRDGDGYGEDCAKGADCDDNDVSVHTDAIESCNRIDDDCDGVIDEELSRECGTSSVGVCMLGKERCVNGAWVECTATLPVTEFCGNNVDDDCDGSVDEDCNKKTEQSKEELALKQFLDLKKGRGKYDLNRYTELQKKTKQVLKTSKFSSVSNGKTKITLRFSTPKLLRNVTIFEYIPKSVAQSASRIVFKVTPEVIQEDPLVAWHFAELKNTVDLSYEVEGEIEGAAEKTASMAIAEDIQEIKQPWFLKAIPLLIIPILGLVFVVIADAVHRKKQ